MNLKNDFCLYLKTDEVLIMGVRGWVWVEFGQTQNQTKYDTLVWAR